MEPIDKVTPKEFTTAARCSIATAYRTFKEIKELNNLPRKAPVTVQAILHYYKITGNNSGEEKS